MSEDVHRRQDLAQQTSAFLKQQKEERDRSSWRRIKRMKDKIVRERALEKLRHAAEEMDRRKAKAVRPPPEDQVVYVIGCAGQPIKIGIATDVEKRRSALQTGFPHKLRIYAHFEVAGGQARAVEQKCHALLADYRMNGEWFDIDPYEAADLVRRVAAQIAA